ncbi:MAG: tyrosine--tRNA ligase [Spirochaetota bacterium]|nr:MAG: tyrosine--tRNA ligase [Spirochaetota bacterium]
MNPYSVLKERGFIFQETDEEALKKLFDRKKVTAYIGFDPSADSLHAGSLVPIMALAHLQRNGHRPIALVGGGTGLVGDPSGKTETRKLLSRAELEGNAEVLKRQLGQYISFDEDQALLLNNAAWLSPLNYIEFLRDIGKHFSVNKMLAAESVKLRLEKGLTFIEFNYMVLQAYDFYVLNKDYDCDLQMGGQDQWGNIVAGIDLTRRISQKEVYGITFPLITDSSGEKFGKSVKGAVWLDSKKTSPYEYYQFFRNTMDSDVERYLGYFTFLPMSEIKELARLKPPLLNRAKEILAFEATSITHSEEDARNAYRASIDKFGEADPGRTVQTSSAILEDDKGAAKSPQVLVELEIIQNGFSVLDAFVKAGLVSSKGEARRLIKQGGAYIEEKRINDESLILTGKDFSDGGLTLRAGKKRHMKLVPKR